MNTRKFFFGLLAFSIMIAAAACTENTADDALYEQGVDKSKVRSSNSVDKSKVRSSNSQSVDKSKVRSSNT